MKRRTILMLLAAVSLAGCATSASGSASPAASAAQGRFPVTLTSANGPVTIAKQPHRIVSVSASATSMIYHIGAGSQVVAVDKYSTDPPDAPRTALTGFETGAESYLTYHPDLVVLAQDPGGTVSAQLAAAGVPALVLVAASSLRDTYAQITTLGRATGHAAGAVAENASIKAQLATVVREVGRRGRGATYYPELDPTLYSATSHTFIGALFGMLGMVNVADAAASSGDQYPQLSPEYLIRSNPRYVFLADGVCCGQSAATFARRPGFSVLQAVRHHGVFVVPDSIASEWGPRVVVFLKMVAKDLGVPSP
ncbi:MAG TPA: ABC transporter substrate-binding protein [Acidimicrobiaceae bacterium]|nr:ABC transporter substrate-binding protein [Acidimicrobiaceae bacterium]